MYLFTFYLLTLKTLSKIMKMYSFVLTVGLVLLAIKYPVLWILIAFAVLLQISVWCITGDLYEFFNRLKGSASDARDFSSSKDQETAYHPEKKEEDLRVLKNFLMQIKLNLWSSEYSFGSEYQNFRKAIRPLIKEAYDWDLAACIRAIPTEISYTTAEITTGREEEMEAHYHNNLRRIQGMMQKELKLRMNEDPIPKTTGVATSSN